jgi:hypothetical protein
MLDISIKQLTKTINTPAKADLFIRQHLTITEKFDGTKLNIIRNSQDFDPNDYTKNWIVSYKGIALFPEEVSGISDKDREGIKKQSITSGQYVFVHDHLRSVHNKTRAIPKNTEFFVEFIQNKKTLTRDYTNKHGLFLIGFGQTKVDISGGSVVSFPESMRTDDASIKKYANLLSLSVLPVLFSGKLQSIESSMAGIQSPQLKAIFEQTIDELDVDIHGNFEDSLSVVLALASILVTFESSIGGKPEGAVIKTDDGQFFKVVQSDQYSKETRMSKKQQYEMSPEKESEYWFEIKVVANKLVSNLNSSLPFRELIKTLSNQIYSLKSLDIYHDKKTTLMKKEDLFLSSKLALQSLLGVSSSTKSIGMFPVAGNPVHIGHWGVINIAAKENDIVYVYTSLKGRARKGEAEISGSDMVEVWKVLKDELPDNVILKYASSPIRAMRQELAGFDPDISDRNLTFTIYSGDDDILKNWSEDVLKKVSPKLLGLGLIKTRGISRSDTKDISGTKMREFLRDGNKGDFERFLPEIDSGKKEMIWNILHKRKSESIMIYVRELLKEILVT